MNDLRRLQLTQLEILKVVDEFCRSHHLHYSLYAGTLLGAVRHQGFIPWDDDLDICMPRGDYMKFLRLWEDNPVPGYILQNKENSPKYTQSFTKIRKDHTTFIQVDSERGAYHTGIFIDIFPMDRIPVGIFKKSWFYLNAIFYQLYTREFSATNESGLINIISKILLQITPKSVGPNIRKKAIAEIIRFSRNPSLPRIGIETFESMHRIYSPALLSAFAGIKFEDMNAMVMTHWDEWLEKKFGKYMELPPVEARSWAHHPIILNFEKNYDELSEDEKTIGNHIECDGITD